MPGPSAHRLSAAPLFPGFGALSCCVALGVSVIGLASSSLLTSLLESVNLDPHTSIAIPQKPALLALTALQLCVVSPLVGGVCVPRDDLPVDAPLPATASR